MTFAGEAGVTLSKRTISNVEGLAANDQLPASDQLVVPAALFHVFWLNAGKAVTNRLAKTLPEMQGIVKRKFAVKFRKPGLLGGIGNLS